SRRPAWSWKCSPAPIRSGSRRWLFLCSLTIQSSFLVSAGAENRGIDARWLEGGFHMDGGGNPGMVLVESVSAFGGAVLLCCLAGEYQEFSSVVGCRFLLRMTG